MAHKVEFITGDDVLVRFNAKHKHGNPARRRKPLVLRPWVKNFVYDLLTRPNIIHCDLYCYLTTDGAVFYKMTYSAGGKSTIAEDWYLMEPNSFKATRLPRKVMRQIYWTRETHSIFRRAHRALVTRAHVLGMTLPGAARVSVHCHYIVVTDANPFPRNAEITTPAYTKRLPDIL